MPTGRALDPDTWNRRAAFRYFRSFEQPFFNVCTTVPVTATLAWCRAHEASFSLASWFLCQQACNAQEPFRMRLRGETVWVHDRVSVATTILDPDDTFRFCVFPYAADFRAFAASARAAIAAPAPPELEGRPEDDTLVHGSTVPWTHFTSISHARRGGGGDSVPKVVFGRYATVDGEVRMPVSVEVHHALMDGLHVGRWFSCLAEAFADPDLHLGSPTA